MEKSPEFLVGFEFGGFIDISISFNFNYLTDTSTVSLFIVFPGKLKQDPLNGSLNLSI